jgi:hypothetical protein
VCASRKIGAVDLLLRAFADRRRGGLRMLFVFLALLPRRGLGLRQRCGRVNADA